MICIRSRGHAWVGSLAVGLMAILLGCAKPGAPEGPTRKEILHVLTQDLQLLTVNAGQPGRVLQRLALRGLPAGESLVGMDYRVSKGVLFTLSRSGRLFTINTENGLLTPVGTEPLATALDGIVFGVDFNPVADRIRIVSNTGQNLRLNPETGAVAAMDPSVAYDAGDAQAGQKPALMAAAYTYNKKDDKLTTNYAIDGRTGTLVRQGSLEGTQPVVSPNTGRLFTVGSLGTGALQDAAMDISDVSNAAFAALQTAPKGPYRLCLVKLDSGKAEALGELAGGSALVGIAVIP